jgi:hypothetical protein
MLVINAGFRVIAAGHAPGDKEEDQFVRACACF